MPRGTAWGFLEKRPIESPPSFCAQPAFVKLKTCLRNQNASGGGRWQHLGLGQVMLAPNLSPTMLQQEGDGWHHSPAPTGAAGGWHLAAPARTSGGGVNGSDRTAVSPNRAMPGVWAVVGPWLKIGPRDGWGCSRRCCPSVCLSVCSPQAWGGRWGAGRTPGHPQHPKPGCAGMVTLGSRGHQHPWVPLRWRGGVRQGRGRRD